MKIEWGRELYYVALTPASHVLKFDPPMVFFLKNAMHIIIQKIVARI